VPMFETMVEFNLIEHFGGRAFDPPLGEPGYFRVFARERRPFRTKDGLICVAVTTDQQWARLFTSIGRPDLAEDERFSTMRRRTFHFAEAYELLAIEIAKESTAHWKAAFEAADLPHGPANRLEDLFDDEHLNAAGFFRRYEHPSEGRLVTTSPAVRYSDTPARLDRPPPRLGEHTKAVLDELGSAEPTPAGEATRRHGQG